jgi:alpha-D-xyloside xylohydrolase
VHGTRTNNQNELWSYGIDAQKILVNYVRLRYRLLPYIYSLAWMTTSKGYTPMRALVMDFRTDVQAANVSDQFMFGPAFLVNPVTDPSAVSRRLYLPRAMWYDFWSGLRVEGARIIESKAPMEQLPLYVRAGSLVPIGPEVEWATEKPPDPIELRVYRGADGNFRLYEDQNENYDYEKGVHATIPFHWDDRGQVLTIGDRSGRFPGMLESRSFRIVFVGKGHGTGAATTEKPDRIVQYAGKQITVRP